MKQWHDLDRTEPLWSAKRAGALSPPPVRCGRGSPPLGSHMTGAHFSPSPTWLGSVSAGPAWLGLLTGDEEGWLICCGILTWAHSVHKSALRCASSKAGSV